MRPMAEWETCGRAERRGRETRAERREGEAAHFKTNHRAQVIATFRIGVHQGAGGLAAARRIWRTSMSVRT